MWRYEHTAQAPVSPEAVWRLWSEVELWPDWNPDIETISIDGPFVAGSKFVMNPDSDEAVPMTLAEVVPGTSFTDLAEFNGLVIRTIHVMEPAEGGNLKITYAMEITGPDADTVGAEVGEQITSDFPETVAALLAQAAAELLLWAWRHKPDNPDIARCHDREDLIFRGDLIGLYDANLSQEKKSSRS
jgi:uncharacterized protein YndB with AHSA1/START domain